MRNARKLGSFTTGESVHGQQLQAAPPAPVNRQWPFKCSRDWGENEELHKGKTGNKSSWGGEDSPVSVIGRCSMMMQAGSQPSSGSASMEHPVFATPSSAHHLSHQYHDSLSRKQPPNSHEYQPSESATDYAGLLSERVQQAFRKSHELQPIVVNKGCNWPTSATNKRMEWLNLQEDRPFGAENQLTFSKCYQYSGHSRNSAGADSIDHLPQDHIQLASSSEGERLSVYSSTRDREDEESVIDFFPSTDRSETVNILRESSRGSNGRISSRVQEERRSSQLNRRSSCIRASPGGGRHHVRIADADDEAGSRASTSSHKWDDAERWLTSPRTTTTTSAPLPPPPPPLHQPPFSAIGGALHGVPKAAPCAQLVQVHSRKPLSGPISTQDKHVPVGGRSHDFMREAGTEARQRDIATQSTPAECESPHGERSSALEKPIIPRQDATRKMSPPRHNTPARRSVSCTKERGSRSPISACEPPRFNSGKLNLLELESCHLDKLKLARDLPLGTSSTWLLLAQEEEEEEEEESRPPESKMAPPQLNILEARVSAWEDVERAKHIAKFKREEAKIEAWETLQRAEANAELQKLEVKLEKLRFEGRDKIMGRLGVAQRRAQEMRGSAEAQKMEQLACVAVRANQMRKSGGLPSSTFNVMCSLTTKIKSTSFT